MAKYSAASRPPIVEWSPERTYSLCGSLLAAKEKQRVRVTSPFRQSILSGGL